jgi:hypothetical protein
MQNDSMMPVGIMRCPWRLPAAVTRFPKRHFNARIVQHVVASSGRTLDSVSCALGGCRAAARSLTVLNPFRAVQRLYGHARTQ